MATPSIDKGGKECRDYAQRLRKREKRGKEMSDEDRQWLTAWEARVAAMPKGRPPKDSQSAAETPADGGDGKTGNDVPQDDAKPADPSPPANATEPPPLEAPPKVAAVPVAAVAGADWRDEHRRRTAFTGDGRKMLCESVADAWATGLGALVDDMVKAGKAPPLGLDPRLPQIKSMAVLAFDELLPERAKLSPKVALLVVTTTTIGARVVHNKAIAEALKDDPDTIAWRKEQEKREAKEHMQAVRHADEVAAAAPPPPKVADPTPPPAAAESPINGAPFSREGRAPAEHREPIANIGEGLF